MISVKSPAAHDPLIFRFIFFLLALTIPVEVNSQREGHIVYPQSMTSLARRSTDVGTITPRSLATLRFTIRSNLDACSTGRSLGLAPLSSRSTYDAARLCK